MLEYRELDSERNEIRLITLLGITAPNPELDQRSDSSLHEEGLVECRLDHASLDEYSSEYSRFLQLDGSARSKLSRAVLWEYIKKSDDVGFGELVEKQKSGMVYETLQTFNHNHLYQDKEKYNKNTTRWIWGDYDALSYVWGDPTITSDILVNGTRVIVTKNLEDALRNLSHNLEDQNRLCVDALCINQGDIAERNIQVKRIKDIYADAENVCAWTGPDLEGGEEVNEFIDRWTTLATTSPEGMEEFIEEIPNIYGDSTWKGVIELISRPYWGRLWIIQEVLLANTSAKVCFGDYQCLLSSWLGVFSLFRDNLILFILDKARELLVCDENAAVSGVPVSFIKSFSHLERLLLLDQFKYTDLPHPDLMLLLDASRNAEQMDCRDKVYALLGLINPKIQDLIVPNYNTSLLDVYRDFSLSVIKATRKLDIIFQGASGTVQNKLWYGVRTGQRCPSWVANLSSASDDHSGSLFNNKEFCAAKDTEHVYDSDSDDNHLRCSGFKVDVIDGLGCTTIVEDHVIHDVVPSAVNSSLANVYTDDEGVRNALWETLTVGNLSKLDPAVLSLYMSLPWFGRDTVDNPMKVSYYTVINGFQQCNQSLEIAGKGLAHYFPSWSEEFNKPPDSQTVSGALNYLMLPLTERRLMTTRKGYVGFVPKKSQSNDLIFVLMGCHVPLVIRPYENGLYQVVGECYVHGIMKGEAIKGLEKSEYELETVILC